MSRNAGPLDTGKTRTDSPLKSPGRSTALQTPGFQPSGPGSDSDLQNRKRIKRVVSHHACANLSQQSRGLIRLASDTPWSQEALQGK